MSRRRGQQQKPVETCISLKRRNDSSVDNTPQRILNVSERKVCSYLGPVRWDKIPSPMNHLFQRRIAAEDGGQSPSMSPQQLLFSKVGDALRTMTGQNAKEPKTKQNDESRQDLQQSLSATSKDEEDDWRNDFLSPGSAISKQSELGKHARSPPPPHERNHLQDYASSPTSSVISSFTETPTSSERYSQRPCPTYVPRSSSENISPGRAPRPRHTRPRSMTYIRNEENSSPPNHRRFNTFSSSIRPPGHDRSSSFTSGRQQRRESPPPTLTLDSLYAEMHDRRQRFGPRDHKVGQTWNLIGNAHFRRKEHDKAMYAYEQSLECTDGCEKPSDYDHIAAANGNLGTVCWCTGDTERSITCIRKVLKIRMESEISKGRDPRESLTVAASYHQLGLALTLHRDYKKALNALSDALEIQQRVLGRKSIDVARTLDAIGKVHLLRGDADRSMHCHQEAYATKYELTGECGALVITSLTNIAAAHLARNEEKEAILAYLAIRNAQSSELRKIGDPEKSARLAMEAGETIQVLVDLFTKTGAYQNAKLAADEALGLYQQAGISKDHPKMEALKQSVKILYSKSL